MQSSTSVLQSMEEEVTRMRQCLQETGSFPGRVPDLSIFNIYSCMYDKQKQM